MGYMEELYEQMEERTQDAFQKGAEKGLRLLEEERARGKKDKKKTGKKGEKNGKV
jgi:hypothetical protein